MKLGITGSRSNSEFDFSDLFSRKNKKFNTFLGRHRISLIITGGARGIDRQAGKCAEQLNIPCRIIRPDYARYRKGSPLKRNLQIIEECDALLVVWNGDPASRGTVYTASQALKNSKRVFVIFSAGEQIEYCIGEIYDENIFFQKMLNE